MARATRSKPAAKATTPEPSTSTTKSLPASVANPPKLFVLPIDTSKDSRIVTLDNPATGTSSRYLFCPEKGFYEFTCVAAPKKTPRSWLITTQEDQSSESKDEEEADKKPEEGHLGTGYVTKGANLFVATPIDIVFLILPALAPKSKKEEKSLFLSLDDHLDALSASSRHFKALLSQHPSLKSKIASRMSTICDTVDAGEPMYRLSVPKLYTLLTQKATRMCKSGLPASLEERFIKPALDIPVMSIKREESSLSTTTIEATESQDTATTSFSSTTTTTATATTTPSDLESQSTTATSISTPPSETTTSPPEPNQLTTPPTIPPLLRLRTSILYLLTTYIPPLLHAPLQTLLTTSTTPDFTPLTSHLSSISALRTQAAALRSLTDNLTRKRGFEEDEDRIAEREEKKRKKEEEEKRKKGESRGVKQLKKVDTSGMMKLSSFFAPKAGVKKA